MGLIFLTSGLKPVTAGWEAQTLPQCYACDKLGKKSQNILHCKMILIEGTISLLFPFWFLKPLNVTDTSFMQLWTHLLYSSFVIKHNLTQNRKKYPSNHHERPQKLKKLQKQQKLVSIVRSWVEQIDPLGKFTFLVAAIHNVRKCVLLLYPSPDLS